MNAFCRRSATAALAMLDSALGVTAKVVGVLALPLALLLFLQWPLRDLLQAYSREANDLAQCLFAIYVAVAITCATRSGAHLAVDAVAHRYSGDARVRLRRVASAVVLVPWSLFVLYAAWPIVTQAVMQLEAFPETFNPGYFVVKAAVALLALLVLLQAVIDVLVGGGEPRD
jgi:TRAP-type mannitol/chloroaromatic compound transport system permease small subunit